MKKLLRVLVVAALLLAIAIPCLASDTTTPTTNPSPVPCTEHQYEVIETVASTCTEQGKIVKQCKVCKHSETEYLPLAEHTKVFVRVTKEATCSEKGKELWGCTKCNWYEERDIEKNPSNHSRKVTKTTEPQGKWEDAGNCKEKSWKATEYCYGCEKYLDKVYGDYGEHNWQKKTEKATCTKEGHSGNYCDICKTWADDAVVYPKADHVKDAGIEVSKATCTQKRVVRHWCKNCKVLLGDFEEGETAPHTPGEAYTVTEPTCTEKGLRAYDCKVCGAKQIKTWKSDSLGHKYEFITVAPTCTEKGTVTEKCKVCGDVKSVVETPAAGHKWGELKEEAHDCIPGRKGLKCLVCGETKDVVVIPAPKDHVAGDWKVTKAPTCTEKGEEAKSCTVCSKVLETREVAAKGHTAGEYTQTKAPTCTEKGEEVSKCTVCNAVVDTREVAAKGHTAGEWITVRQPSASQNGKMIQKCTVCGAQIGKKYIRANGSADTAAKTVAYVAGAEVANYAKIDLTVDATTELDLVSANGTKVGKLVVEVKEGKVTVKYELSAVPADAFLTFVAEAPSKDIHAEKEFEFEKAISVADELAGAAAAYIYVEIEY